MATQKGRNWSSGDIVTAANLQSIERGVSVVAEEYTPTTWANGNTVTAAALNNIEQGIANAGGSSDFSTATVTFICTENYYAISGGYFIQNGNAIIPTAPTAIMVTSNNNIELEIPLYNGQVALPLMCFFDTDESVLPTVTGDITLNMGSLSFDITGDGSISFKGEGRA